MLTSVSDRITVEHVDHFALASCIGATGDKQDDKTGAMQGQRSTYSKG